MLDQQVLGAGRLAGQAAATCRRAAGPSSTTTTSTRTSTTPRWSLMALDQIDGPGRRPAAPGHRARPRLVPRHAGQGRRLGVVRRRQRPAPLQQHPVRRSRRAPRPVHGGPDRPRASSCFGRARAPGDDPAIQRALAFLRRTQTPDGRVVRPLGRELHLRHVVGAPRARGHRASAPTSPMVRRAIRWLERRQNADGGWGETCDSYADARAGGAGRRRRARRRGRCSASSPRARRAGPGGRARHRVPPADASAPTAAGTTRSGTARASPGSSTCKYHLYAHYFPLWALGAWRRRAVEHGGSRQTRTAAARFPASTPSRVSGGRPRYRLGPRALRRLPRPGAALGSSSRRSRLARRSSGSSSSASARCPSSC